MYKNDIGIEDSEPLILLPGLMCDGTMFAAQMAAFPTAGSAPSYFDLDSLGAMAERALASAPQRFALLGHSMGGRIALEVLRRAPDRVTRLALVSTGTHLPRDGEREGRHALRDLGRSQGIGALVDAWLPPMLGRAAAQDTALVKKLAKMCRNADMAGYEAQEAALLSRPDVTDLLPTIACPVLVAVGSEDRWSTPDQHRAIASAIPGAELVVIEGAGHMLPVEAPLPFNAALARWLAQPTIDEINHKRRA